MRQISNMLLYKFWVKCKSCVFFSAFVSYRYQNCILVLLFTVYELYFLSTIAYFLYDFIVIVVGSVSSIFLFFNLFLKKIFFIEG